MQCARDNIRCNVVLPGMKATDAAIVYFASDESAFTTGQIMDVSGGFGLPTPVYSDMIDMKTKR